MKVRVIPPDILPGETKTYYKESRQVFYVCLPRNIWAALTVTQLGNLHCDRVEITVKVLPR